ncbi:predicted protein [Naegleria gruberi]|uniref:Predicted protein n=1 Tax=Naegleria gruberi TaxID=5762 RepID=D2VRQ2_NAEGR|nr:uncharacterized protein NAEGRDRAFT_71665 [Naegleria gruberi]EFC40429.1 predicted protein [Naegleria gruberi]|eukprot:XP_002673173.1 predicted protein [Naegleria gruberi strain NEG-M]
MPSSSFLIPSSPIPSALTTTTAATVSSSAATTASMVRFGTANVYKETPPYSPQSPMIALRRQSLLLSATQFPSTSSQQIKSRWMLVRVLDGIIYIVSEYTKTLIRELILLLGYFLDLIVSLVLYVFHIPGSYDETSLAHQKGLVVRSASSASLIHLSEEFRKERTRSRSNSTKSNSGGSTYEYNSSEEEMEKKISSTSSTGTLSPIRELSPTTTDEDHNIQLDNQQLEDDVPPPITTSLFSSSTSSHTMIGKNSFKKILESTLKMKKANNTNQVVVDSPTTMTTSTIEPVSFEEAQKEPIADDVSVASTADSEWNDYENLDANFDYDFEDDVRDDIKLIYEEKKWTSRVLNFIGETFLWFVMLIIYLPTLFKTPITSKKTPIEADKVHLYEKKSTGLLEDFYYAVFECIDLLAKASRLFIRLKLRECFKTIKECFGLFKLSNFLSTRGIDDRSISQVIIDNGFKSKTYVCSTEDGYKVQLNRIPNTTSKTAVYFQHGILDSGFTWIGSNPNVGLTCASNGYDVFLGNFRGYGLARCHGKHLNENISAREYWDFSINEHAFYDVKAFVKKIREIKQKELGNNDFKLVVVAHSMGAGSILAYMSWCKAHNEEHYIDKAILLSPAGNHQEMPTLFEYASMAIPIVRRLPFWNYFGFTSKTVKILVAKLLQDINNHKATRSLLSAVVSSLILGGRTKNNPFQYVHNLFYHTFNATSVKVVEHLIQLQKSGKFLAYNYGPTMNKQYYGTEKPYDFFDAYDKLNIPIYIVYADDDKVIPKQCIVRHYKELRKYHSNTCFAKKFKDMGHLELTLSSNDRVIQYVLKVLGQNEEVN